MALNSSNKDVIAQRRMLVARARLRGITQREIVKALEAQGSVNPKTGIPWTWVTVHTDIKAIEKAWREEMLRDTSEHKARSLAELAEIKRRGWSQDDIDLVLKALTQERAVIGADAPQQININVQQEIDSLLTELTSLTSSESSSTESSTVH